MSQTPPGIKIKRETDSFLWLYASVAGSLLLRLSLFDYQSGDYRAFLSKWFDFFIQHGRWNGLGMNEPYLTYPPLYFYFISLSTLLPLPQLYAIKTISVAADYVGAWYAWRLVRKGFPEGRFSWAATTVLLFLPTVVMNSALWGQCDMMFTAGFLASLYYLLEKRPVAAWIAFGLSCSLKPQAVFWCPLLAGLLVNGRLSWKQIWIPVGVYLGCGLPAVLAGLPIMTMIMHWAHAQSIPGLTLGATNWYQWIFEQNPEVFWMPGLVLTLVATAFLALWMREKRPSHLSDSQWLVSLATLSVLFPPFFLPGMHERYFFAADVLSVVYAFYLPRGFRVTLLIQFASAFTYLPYLFEQEPVPRRLLPLPILAAMGLVVWELRPKEPRAGASGGRGASTNGTEQAAKE